MRRAILIGSILLAIQPAFADSDDSVSTVAKITALTNQIAVLQQELAVAKLKAEIASADGGSVPVSPAPGAVSPLQAGMAVAQQPAPAAPIKEALPSVVSISGSGAKLSAVLQLPGGGKVLAYPGLALSDNLTVYDISYTSVRVRNNGKVEILPFQSDETGSVGNNNRTAVNVPLPPLPGAR